MRFIFYDAQNLLGKSLCLEHVFTLGTHRKLKECIRAVFIIYKCFKVCFLKRTVFMGLIEEHIFGVKRSMGSYSLL